MTRKPVEERAYSLLKEFLLMFSSQLHTFYNITRWFKIYMYLHMKVFSVLFTFIAGNQTKIYINSAFEMGNYLDGHCDGYQKIETDTTLT